METKKQLRVVGAIIALALIVGTGIWAERRINPRPGRVAFDGVSFEGGDPFERNAVGEVIMAVRRSSHADLMALDQGDNSYADPRAGRAGAKWLLTNYGNRLDGKVHVRFAPPALSDRELTGCLSFGQGEHLVVLGLRDDSTPSYTIRMGSFPMERSEAVAHCGDGWA